MQSRLPKLTFVFALLALAAVLGPARLFAADAPPEPTELEVRAEYDRGRANWHGRNAGQKEYDVRHIQVATRAEAEAVLARIARGERFEDVARAVSTDSGTAAKGGSLGWTVPPDIVEPFAVAMTALGPAGLSRDPVRTAFGWHVIQVLDVREPVFPPFDDAKAMVRQALKRGIGEWTLYDRSGIYARELDTRSLEARGDRVFFRYRERAVAGTNAPQATAPPIRAVVDCARDERADLGANGSFELQPVFPNTVQSRQLDFVCKRVFLGAREAAAAMDGLSCASPATISLPGFSRANGFAGVTVIVRGQVSVPASATGEAFVESTSGYPLIDEAAVKAFKAMQCTARGGRREARWVRQSFVFSPEAATP